MAKSCDTCGRSFARSGKLCVASEVGHCVDWNDWIPDTELEQLQRTIQQKTIELNKLQARHREITGQYFVISGPLPCCDSPGKERCDQ